MSFKNRRVENEFKNFNAWKSLIGLVATIAVTILIKQLFLPDNVEDFGAWSTLPALFLVVYIFITKRIIEALVLATFVGWIMCAQPGGNVLTTFNETFLATMQTGSDRLLAYYRMRHYGRHHCTYRKIRRCICLRRMGCKREPSLKRQRLCGHGSLEL